MNDFMRYKRLFVNAISYEYDYLKQYKEFTIEWIENKKHEADLAETENDIGIIIGTSIYEIENILEIMDESLDDCTFFNDIKTELEQID